MSNYNAFEQMSNLNRQDEREHRRLSSPNRPGQAQTTLAPFFQHNNNVEIFKSSMPPFLKKLVDNLALKHAKLFCAIKNLEQKLKDMDEHLPGQPLPALLSLQQKYYDSLANNELKESFVKHLLDNKKALIQKKIDEHKEMYESRSEELKSFTDPLSFENCGSNYFKDCGIKWPKLLDSLIQIQICTMRAKALQDDLQKRRKKEIFDAKKEKLSAPKVITVGEFEKLTANLKNLQLTKKGKASKPKPTSKNSKGEKTTGKSPSPKKKDQKKTQRKGKAKTSSRENGNTKDTSARKK